VLYYFGILYVDDHMDINAHITNIQRAPEAFRRASSGMSRESEPIADDASIQGKPHEPLKKCDPSLFASKVVHSFVEELLLARNLDAAKRSLAYKHNKPQGGEVEFEDNVVVIGGIKLDVKPNRNRDAS
jgi:hypothetical protein